MSELDDDIPTHSYWPSVTDLFLTLFIIAIAIVAVVFCALLPTNNVGKDAAIVHAVGNDLRHIREPLNRLRESLALPALSPADSPQEVIRQLGITSDNAVNRIRELEQRLKAIMDAGGAEAELERLRRENEELKSQLEALRKKIDKLNQLGNLDALALIEDLKRQLNDRPPIIQISDDGKYRFESGSSAMNTDFTNALKEGEFKRLADEIVARQEEGRVKVDTLEIIGHTDGVALSRTGNLDQKLPEVLADGTAGISSLIPGSNNDLGLLRALAVREQWHRFIADHPQRGTLEKIQVRCYSAGQTILPTANPAPTPGDFRKPDPTARRIEMRLTRLAN